MAYLYVRKNGRREIREARSTPRGPRSRTLASFRGPLTDELLDRAEAVSARGFDRAAIRARAALLGIPIVRASADSAARALIAQLRNGAHLDPVLATVLRGQLASADSATVPDELTDAVEWIGAHDRERGRALRDVLRLYDTIARSRDAVREPDANRFPHLSVRPGRRAS
jgi:hypothetical protein